MIPGGIVERADGGAGRNVMVVCPVCKLPTRVGYSTRKDDKGETSRSASASARAAARRSTGDGRPTETYVPRLKQRYNDELRGRAQGRARRRLDHAGAADHEDHAQHGRRRGEDRREGARRGDRGADDHRRPARADAPRPQVDRAVQDPRGDADRREGDAARRPDVGVPRPARSRSRCRGSATSAASTRTRSTAAATTRSASASRSSSPRSTTTASTRSAASTSRSRRPPRPTSRPRALLRGLGPAARDRGTEGRAEWRRSR